jgi:hypothetical protein
MTNYFFQQNVDIKFLRLQLLAGPGANNNDRICEVSFFKVLLFQSKTQQSLLHLAKYLTIVLS